MLLVNLDKDMCTKGPKIRLQCIDKNIEISDISLNNHKHFIKMTFLPTIFGTLAGIGTTFSFLPQVYKIYRVNMIDGLSPYLLIVHFSGVSFWIVYGFLIHDIFVLTFNGITLFFLCLLIAKYLYILKQNQRTLEIFK